jgi:hypothetical protein
VWKRDMCKEGWGKLKKKGKEGMDPSILFFYLKKGANSDFT